MAYLLQHQNRNSKERGDGKYWGYQSRRGQPVTLGILHSGENMPDYTPPDEGAESIARYLASSTRPASYHDVMDSDSHIELLPSDHVAFHCRGRFDNGTGINGGSHGVSMATQARSWKEVPTIWRGRILESCAQVVATRSAEHGLPFVLLDEGQARRGERGWTTHQRMDSGRRSDPGLSVFELRALLKRAEQIFLDREGAGMLISIIDPLAVTSVPGRVPFWSINSMGKVTSHNGARTPTFDVSSLDLVAPITGAAFHQGKLVLVAEGDSGTFALHLISPA